jgi:hypothetical protein
MGDFGTYFIIKNSIFEKSSTLYVQIFKNLDLKAPGIKLWYSQMHE